VTSVTSEHAKVGALHALANAARFLEDASILYEHKRQSGSYLHTVAAREEHGRFNLLCFAAKEIEGGSSISVKDIRTRLRPVDKPHHAKLQAGQSTYYTPAPLPVETFRQREARYAQMQAVDSRATHERRLAEQYVDLNPNGLWSTPGHITLHEVLAFLWVVGGEVGSSLMSIEDEATFFGTTARTEVSLPRSIDVCSRIFSLPQFACAPT
jgi:AbiV family abortive infection protein